MCIRRLRSIRKALLQFPVAVQRLIVLMMDEMQIGGGEQRCFQPGTGGSGLSQFINRAVKSGIVVRCPGDFSENIEAMRTLLRTCSLQIGNFRLGVTVPASAMQRVCQSELSLDPRLRSGVGHSVERIQKQHRHIAGL